MLRMFNNISVNIIIYTLDTVMFSKQIRYSFIPYIFLKFYFYFRIHNLFSVEYFKNKKDVSIYIVNHKIIWLFLIFGNQMYQSRKIYKISITKRKLSSLNNWSIIRILIKHILVLHRNMIRRNIVSIRIL